MNTKQLNEFKKLTNRKSLPFFRFENELSAAVTKHFKRRQKVETISVKTFCYELIQKRLNKLAYYLPSDGYSMGGVQKITVNKYLEGIYDDRRNYANSCKYRPTHGFVNYNIKFNELKNYSVIGGLITYIYPNQKTKVKKCFWLQGSGKKQNFELKEIQGYIYNDYHGLCKKNVFEQGEKNRKREAERKKQAEKTAKNKAKALNCLYSYEDSLKSGNCEAGTRAFILRCKLDINKKYKGKTLLKIAKEKSTSSIGFVNRMLYYKASKL